MMSGSSNPFNSGAQIEGKRHFCSIKMLNLLGIILVRSKANKFSP